MQTILMEIREIGLAYYVDYKDPYRRYNIIQKGLESLKITSQDLAAIVFDMPDTYKHHEIEQVYFKPIEQGGIKISAYAKDKPGEIYSNQLTLETDNYRYNIYASIQFEKNLIIKPAYIVPFDNVLILYNNENFTVTKSFPIYADIKELAKPAFVQIRSGYVNHRSNESIGFSAVYNKSIFKQFSVKSGVFKYREKGVTAFNQIEFDGSNVTIQPNTLLGGKTYECYASCKSDDNQVSDTSIVEMNTIDSVPRLIGISPVNEITYGDVEFSWNYVNETGTRQYAYDLQVSSDGISFNNLETHVITESTVVKKEMQAGTIYWRVKGYNQNDIPSEWSEIYKFVNVAKPTIPIIKDVISCGRPIVKWLSENQIAFEFEIIGIFRTGQVYSTDKFYRIEKYLPNGSYVCRLRIFNQYAQASDWVQFTYNQNMNVNAPIGLVERIDNGFKISIDLNSEFTKYYLLRNDVLIHKFNSNEYDDLFVCGITKYTIRAVDQNDNFSDLVIKVEFKNNRSQIISMDGVVYDLSNRLNNKPVHNVVISRENKMINFLNREKPTNYQGTACFKTFSITCSSSFNHLGEVLFYRNYFGDFGFVVCNSITKTNSDILDEIQFNLDVIDFEEGIDYDE
ncbi:MAG: hypothetical protein RR738_04870 [Anaerorhabdus sp.]|uniref:hypothetical protein n=1 Tax=Anaerorhabdus sp. TaxID=1872524 RepID=UPI002FC9D4CE